MAAARSVDGRRALLVGLQRVCLGLEQRLQRAVLIIGNGEADGGAALAVGLVEIRLRRREYCDEHRIALLRGPCQSRRADVRRLIEHLRTEGGRTNEQLDCSLLMMVCCVHQRWLEWRLRPRIGQRYAMRNEGAQHL